MTFFVIYVGYIGKLTINIPYDFMILFEERAEDFIQATLSFDSYCKG